MPVYTTGSTALSFTQQFLRQDPTKYVVGGYLYTYLPGTTVPLTGYKDPNATLPWPNPYVLAQDGRIPNIFFIQTIDTVPVGYSSVRMRLVDKNGLLQFDFDNIPLLGPGGSGGGGGGDTTDPNSVLITGDLKPRYGVGTLPGFVRCNGLTIGPLSSGSTERANADCQALFQYLWNNDANLVVVGGRGASSQADWDSGVKQITLPDWSGCALGFLDDMSGVPRGVLTAATFTGLAPTVLGAKGGIEKINLSIAQMPVHAHDAFLDDPGHTHTPDGAGKFLTDNTAGAGAFIGGAQGVRTDVKTGLTKTLMHVKSTNAAQGSGIDDKTSSVGSGQITPLIQPTKLCTVYIRL